MGGLRVSSYKQNDHVIVLQLQNISKSFAGIKALQDVSLRFKAGEVHALCGENGAGKSTLMNIIMGNLQPDKGIILWKDEPIKITGVLTAHRLGISIVYQERSLADALTIAENIFPVNAPLTRSGLISYSLLYRKTKALLDELGLFDISPKGLVGKLSGAQKQMIEVAKAIAQEPSFLILDEPTASLTHPEAEILFNVIAILKKRGVGIIYISHRMPEIQRIADKVSVLKDGKFVGTVDRDTPVETIIYMMVGRELEAIDKISHVQSEVKFEVKKISGRGFYEVSFQLFKGEILGFAGLQGSGRTNMARSLFGDEKISSGKILKDGKEFRVNHPSEAMNGHVMYVPDERKTEGLFADKSVAENLFSAQLKTGFYNESHVTSESKKYCVDFGVRTATVKTPVRELSGGNQQKVMLARSLALRPAILIINEPTHGVDVGSKADIYGLLKKLTAGGTSILLISNELPELLLLANRIAIMHEGKIVAILNQHEATEEKITLLASGINT